MCALFAMNVAVDASKVDLTQHIKIGQEDTITFGVRGYPKPQITWKKGGRTLNPANDALTNYWMMAPWQLSMSKYLTKATTPLLWNKEAI